jgi:hypothetical protein
VLSGGPGVAIRVSESQNFSPPACPADRGFARDAEVAKRKYISFSAERAEKERFYAHKEEKFIVEHL